jgi:capsid protein
MAFKPLRFLAGILDAGERSRGRRALEVYGRATPGDEDRLYPQSDRDTTAQKCYDLIRNNPVISGASDRIVDNVVGSKIVMQARTSDPVWNAKAERWLKNWCAAIDPEKRTNFTTSARLTVAARLYAGEIFHMPTPDGQLAIIEAERIRKPQNDRNAVGGLNGYRQDPITGRVTGWCVHGRDANGGFGSTHAEQWVPFLFHPHYRWRPDQVRGWPMLAKVANMATDIHEINNANLRKNKMGAMAAWVYKKGQSGGGLQGRTAATSSTGQPLQKFTDGQIYEIESGSELAPFLNNQPGAEYAPFMELNLRMFGMAVGLPYEFLLMYFGGGSFSSSKSSLLQAYKTIDTWQEWLDCDYLLPVTQWRIAKAITDRELPPAPVDSDGVSEFGKWEWQRPGVEWIDPQNAIQNDMQEVRIGATSMYKVCGKRGADAEETARDNARYLIMLDKVGKEFGVDPARLHNIQIPGQTPAVADKPKAIDTEDDKGDKPNE